MTEKSFDVTLTLSDEDYAVLTRALTEYADELEFRANDPAEAHNAASFRGDVDRARHWSTSSRRLSTSPDRTAAADRRTAAAASIAIT